MLWGYFDESGEHGPDGKLLRLTLGGFFAPWQAVEQLCQVWRKALDDEGLSEFHMKEIASDERAYDQWPPARQLRLDRFIDIVCEYAVNFCAFKYSTGAAKKEKLFRDTYECAMTRTMIIAASLCEKNKQTAHIVYAKTHEIKEELIGLYFDRLGWGEFLEFYTTQKSGSS